MIAAVSPADYNFDETLSTLKYANRAKSIENAVKRNEDRNDRMIKDLKQEIERLKQQVRLLSLHCHTLLTTHITHIFNDIQLRQHTL